MFRCDASLVEEGRFQFISKEGVLQHLRFPTEEARKAAAEAIYEVSSDGLSDDHVGTKIFVTEGVVLALWEQLDLENKRQFGEQAGTGPRVIGTEEAATYEAEHTSKLDNAYVSGGTDNEVEVEETNGLLILPESDGSFTVAPEVKDQQWEHVMVVALDKEKSEMPYMSGDSGSYYTTRV
ncbi:hypothetical protein F0562_025553 [Nyssa sinensis]|uniref:Uncharacterized protein n=1 Tax=Nyssa sinensis TaxID=561372 RepID=A0A5J5BCB9_9ASTE|nr:hypothetical protein F0562_025553 [Nyssa sinensis]